MRMINRCAVIVRPRPPFLEWMRKSDVDGIANQLFMDMYEQPAAYLLDDHRGDVEPVRALADAWPQIFESMLEGWSTDTSEWPRDRSRRLFDQWLDCDFAPEVIDVAPSPLEGVELAPGAE